MSAKGCHHLQGFKKDHKNLESLKWIHAVFVVANTHSSATLKTKICNSYCRTCKKRGPFLHACLECVFLGCHKHIREHMKNQKHTISMDLTYGQIHCNSCYDYVYDAEIDEITMDNKMKCGKFKKRLFEWTSWDATEEERDLLTHRTKKICITPESTIGLRGLWNLGNTCFMNCIIQALMHTPLLRDYFLTKKHKCNEIPGTCLACTVSKLFQGTISASTATATAALDVLHRHCYDTMPKNAIAAEKKDKCPCIIDQIFTGCLQSDVVCQKCKGVSTTFDPILDFSLDLGPVPLDGRQPCSLHDCLERFTRAEDLEDEKILCSNCGSHQVSTKQFTMKTLPIVVSFHLKRFQHLKNEIEKKISTLITFPEMLDMTPFMSRTKHECPIPSDNRYSLFAVINHIGNSMSAGHYIAFVRQQHNSWYKCDDHVITRANLKEVLDSEGYLLFYHKHVLRYE
ncbi:hypothetical protein NQ315_003795 [Exocentrus adspersus]|uniref:Ubiquitin carboxyl-terminal hydrolase n=1 Tax=Exocentrus adspersus TaxID=1586481 RepID=A0AAV8VED1_9CUCU|nr:hypothetical protein NQ315_003795 [Exocentrus adspersus]